MPEAEIYIKIVYIAEFLIVPDWQLRMRHGNGICE